MNSPPKQRSTYPRYTSPPRQHDVPPMTGMFRQELPQSPQDFFSGMLQGPTLTFVLTSASSLSLRRYTLPVALVCYNSVQSRDAFDLLANADSHRNKRRKIDKVSIDSGEHELRDENVNEKGTMIHLPNVDHITFGLFLEFIYTGKYTDDVDEFLISRKVTSRPPYIMLIPQSVCAWLLGKRLGSIAFTNYAIRNIHHDLGTYFALTPSLVDFVWMATAPRPRKSAAVAIEKKDFVGVEKEKDWETTQSPTTNSGTHPPRAKSPVTESSPPNQPPISPLRRFFLDALIVHWLNKSSDSIISRSQHQPDAWNALFKKHADLSSSLLFGLQGHATMGHVEDYYVG